VAGLAEKESFMALINATSIRRSACLAAGAVFAATVALGAVSAVARGDDHRDHRDHWHGGGYRGGYYGPPPVVYNSPYSYGAPPVVYGPGFGINLNIR
jgi:hypothetical protein